MTELQNIHATGISLARKGVLLRGPSGAGKSLLALDLLEHWTVIGKQARLVADDRLNISVSNGALYMHTPPAIAGMIELRGRGIVRRPIVKRARVHLIVDIVAEMDRLVEESALVTTLAGVSVARCPIPRRDATDALHQRLLIIEALSALGDVQTNIT